MWNAIATEAMPSYWPPRPSRFWATVLEPLRRRYLRRYYGIGEIVIEERAPVFKQIGPADSVLLTPNHSHDSDPHVMMEVARRLGRRAHFMAAWQIFRTHWGIDGWVLQRLGAFSVDREGVDRRAIRQATDLLKNRATLVIFPEGEVYHLNERLTPLLEGVAFIALAAQKELNGAKIGRVWIVPTAIRYRYLEDVQPQLQATMERLEARMLWKSAAGAPLHERILRFGELLLTIKEKEKLAHSCETEGDLPTRIRRLIAALLERLEKTHLKGTPGGDTVPLRVKALRRHLLEAWTSEAAAPESRRQAREALDEVQLVLQLYSYPGDYVTERPSVERMAETIEKFEEDIEGYSRPKGKRGAQVVFGEPIDLSQALGGGRLRQVATDITTRMENAIQGLMK